MEKVHLYIVLMRTNTMISYVIHLFTRDQYTHAALSLDKELKEMYSFGRKHTHNPFIGRFRRERLEEGIYKIADHLPGIVLEIDVPRENYVKARELVGQFIAHSSRYKYNVRGLVYALVNRPTTRDDRFLCSQFVYHVLYESGIADFQIPANLVRPDDFLSLESHIIYQGDLKELATKEVGHGPSDCSVRIRLYRWVRKRVSLTKAS